MAYDQQLADAVAEIARLRAENERLRAALEAIANGAAGDVPSRFARRALEQKARLRCAECDCGDGPCNWIAEQSQRSAQADTVGSPANPDQESSTPG